MLDRAAAEPRTSTPHLNALRQGRQLVAACQVQGTPAGHKTGKPPHFRGQRRVWHTSVSNVPHLELPNRAAPTARHACNAANQLVRKQNPPTGDTVALDSEIGQRTSVQNGKPPTLASAGTVFAVILATFMIGSDDCSQRLPGLERSKASAPAVVVTCAGPAATRYTCLIR